MISLPQVLSYRRIASLAVFLFAVSFSPALPEGGLPVIPMGSHLDATIHGLDQTGAQAEVLVVDGPGFREAREVTISLSSAQTNATQLTIPNSVSIPQGAVLLAEFWIRGERPDGTRALIELHFERSSSPWTKSVSYLARADMDPLVWRRVLVPFASMETYQPGQAMVSMRFAFGPQRVELGGLRVVSYGSTLSLEDLRGMAVEAQPLGEVRLDLRPEIVYQRLRGMGGNFTRPRYGRTESMDAVGQWNLAHLEVVHARIGIPLNYFHPQPGVFRTDGPVRASYEAMQILADRGLPLVASIWEGPVWMMGGQPEQMGRVLSPERYGECIAAIVRYLVIARDEYGVEVDYVSFNEPDHGVNFKFSPQEMIAFLRLAGPVFAEASLKTRWIAGDTANGRALPDYVAPLFEDPEVSALLGPISFHSWDALSAGEQEYRRIAAAGQKFEREIWCLEAGHDPLLWQLERPWGDWENAFRTAWAYARTVRLSGASLVSYWTYQDDYPLWDRVTGKPYSVFHVMKQMEDVLRPGFQVSEAEHSSYDLEALFTINHKDGHYAILLVNPVGAGSIRIQGWPAGQPAFAVVSNADKQGQRYLHHATVEGVLNIPLSARSVVTISTARDEVD